MRPEQAERQDGPSRIEGGPGAAPSIGPGEAAAPVRRAGWWDVLALSWVVPLAVASYALFRTVRRGTTLARDLGTRRRPERGLVWRALGPELLEERLATVEMATLGPRWNPHATIGVAGPFNLSGSPDRAEEIGISVDLRALRRSADEWTLVVYRFPDYRTVAAVASARDQGDARAYVDLAPGRYVLGLRYYGVDEDAVFPEVWTSSADGAERIPERPVPTDVSALYRRLAAGRGLLYRMLAYHALQLLRYRRWLPRTLVERVLLPVGNPETRFAYGPLGPGEVVEVTPDLLGGDDRGAGDGWDLFITLYGPDSLPRRWCRLDTNGGGAGEGRGVKIGPLPEGGFFVLRAHPRSESSRPAGVVEVCAGDAR